MKTDALRRLAALGLACTAVAGFAACGSDDDGSSGSAATTPAQADAPALTAADARTLADARATIAEQCEDDAAVTGAVATLESLYEIDPKAADAKGTTVREAVTDATAQLRSCGNKAAAKRLAKLAG